MANATKSAGRGRWGRPARGGLHYTARFIARRLPPPRDKSFLRLAATARDLVLGRPGPRLAPPGPPRSPALLPRPVQRPVARLTETDITWRTPPAVTNSGTQVHSIYHTGAAAPRYDVELLEKLNAEYADKPIVPQAPQYDPESLTRNARRRSLWVHNLVDLKGKRTLEIGCGNGYEVWHIGEHLAAEAYGVDVAEYGPWPALASDRVHFACADLTVDNPFSPDFFDRIMSFTVWEHVLHPCRLLEETYRILRPGGLVWMNANLYAGPRASHRYRDIYFPWPHLLFSDDVIKEWQRKHGKEPNGSAWVNRLSWHHYQYYFDRIGFRVRHLTFTEMPMDEEFYERFEDVLGRFPRWDLTKDFFLAVLEKPA
ncbi:MAG: 2-polyprenyl-6-hydroxyphenyl methylase / 3-demethylubiquinone-9 3-methyltransferase [Streptosporangiaceae bacterium]|jgi:SAM-dependent methyltransferase|nr:2-polyprenyl-6-hydroxyphenyl methylase / 3-demethylubiquinone-9 3-methyltransferase [Streptosporangiaceae bacterium]